MSTRACAALVGLATALGCSGPSQPAPQTPAALAIVKIESNVRDALVYVDGRFEATLDRMRGGLAVTPGVHRIELRHDDYFSRYLEVTLERSERRMLQMEMAPLLP